MAMKLNPESAVEHHNVGNRTALIKECAQQMIDITASRKELNEDAAGVRERLKEAGVQTRAFDFALRLQAMETEAREDYTDSLRETYDALGIGGQLDFLPAVDAAKGNGAETSPTPAG